MAQNISDMPTNVDLEFAVKTERVLAVLDGTIQRTQVALCLPLLLRFNGTLIQPLLSPKELATVLAACKKYTSEGDDPLTDPPSSTMGSYYPSVNQSVREDRWSSAMGLVQGLDERNDPNVSHALHILCNNQKVVNMATTQLLPQAATYTGVHTWLPTVRADTFDIDRLECEQVSKTASVFLEYLVRLRERVADRLSRTPDAEQARDLQLRAAWRGNIQVETERQQLAERLAEQRAQLGGQVASKARAIAQLRNTVDRVRRQCQDEVKRIVYQSERSMIMEWRNSGHRQETLSTELKDANNHLGNLQADHLRDEKELRVKRYKMETLLLTWLQKFDADVSDKQQEYEQLCEEYEAEQQQMEELEKQMSEQEAEYRLLLEEKERYEKEEEDELVYMLASKWAAKVIQRAWRAYQLRKKLAKGSKKGKGKGKGKKKK